ncbi:MAG TPA: DUF2141 domain-containing protein [Candidatus Binataceae bacterium]|nr:DUF2141 domain-containing protein [Candidatus Binataceae bacterium]
MTAGKKASWLGLLLVSIVIIAPKFACAQGKDDTGTLSVEITNLHNDKGVVRCALYSDPDQFPKGDYFRATTASIADKKATCVFKKLPPGTYAIAAFQAEHNERRMSYNFLGMPLEGYGFSDNAPSSFAPPAFSTAAITFRGGEASSKITLHYR